MSRQCYLCGEGLSRPGSQEIKDIYKKQRIMLCLTCLGYYKRDPQYWLNYKECGRERCETTACGECGERRPLFDGYCTPCWVRYHDRPEDPAPPSPPAPPQPTRRPHTHVECARRETESQRQEPESWSCPACTNINRAGAAFCDACGLKRGAVPTLEQDGGAQPPQPAASECSAPPAAAQEWECSVCTLINEASESVCGACGASRFKTADDSAAPAPTPDLPVPSRSHSPSYADSDAESDASSVADGWECPSCTLINRQDVLRCVVCDEAREEDEVDAAEDAPAEDLAAAELAVHEAPGWTCSFCTYVNAADAEVCGVCEAPSGAWQCTRCKGSNPAGMDHCKHCDLERGWKCEACTFMNPPGTKACSMCDAPRKAVALSKPSTRRKNETQSPKASASPVSAEYEENDTWKCGKCTGINDADCLVCEICGAYKTRARSNKVLSIGGGAADRYDDVIRARPVAKKPAAKRAAPQRPAGGKGGKGTRGGKGGRGIPAGRASPSGPAVHYAIGNRKLMIINNLRKSDKVNNHALRLVFDKLGACNVAVIVKDGKKTGQGVVEFDTEDELQAALEKTRKMTICESKIKTYRCSLEDFKALPESWKKGKVQPVARPDHIPDGPRVISRVAVVRADRCKNDQCARECHKICPVRATNDYGVCKIDEAKCTGCNMCVKKKVHKGKTQGCPFNAILIVNIPKELTDALVNRYGRNGFSIARLPVLKPERLLGLVGENGAGKSTVLKILAGKLVPNGGVPGPASGSKWPDAVKAQYKGTELWGLILRLETGRARAALKVQHVDRLREETTVSVREFLGVERADPKRVAVLVKELCLGAVMDRMVNVLSGGEIQRVAVAAAVLKDADIYLFDEPSSFLDVRQRLRVCEAIRDVLDGSRYVVCVEHDLAVCDYLADSVAVLHGKAGAFGVVSKPMNVRDGINAFLQGFIEHENVRFRNKALNFKMHDQDDEPVWTGGDIVRHSYPTVTITRGSFSLAIKSGELRACEVTAFLGENGCGKTTLLEMMSGLLKPDSGDTFMAAKTYLKPQIITMPPRRTVKEVIDENIRNIEKHTQRHQVIMDEVMEPLMIEDLLVLEADKLSGGEMQRVALAIALSSTADVLLIDEPSAFLDAELRMTAAKAIRRVALLLRKIVVVVEHDLMMTSFMADRVVVFEGTPAVECAASSAEPVSSGLNRFLRQLDVSVRLDAVTHRPRFNKRGSVLDREQRAKGEYYADAAEIKDVIDGTMCPVCDFVMPDKARLCGRCGIRIEDEDR